MFLRYFSNFKQDWRDTQIYRGNREKKWKGLKREIKGRKTDRMNRMLNCLIISKFRIVKCFRPLFILTYRRSNLISLQTYRQSYSLLQTLYLYIVTLILPGINPNEDFWVGDDIWEIFLKSIIEVCIKNIVRAGSYHSPLSPGEIWQKCGKFGLNTRQKMLNDIVRVCDAVRGGLPSGTSLRTHQQYFWGLSFVHPFHDFK